MLIALVLASATVQANEIDNLIDASGSLKQSFALGIQTVGGQATYAQSGGISPNMATDAYITQAQATAYNDALVRVSKTNYNITAQEYFNTQAGNAMEVLSIAVDSYVSAATDLIGAVQVNEMAVNAVDQESTTALQTYVTNNELSITTESVDTYNGALDTVQQAAQAAASFTAIANDQSLVDSAQAQADALGESFSFVQDAYYSQGNMTIALVAGDIGLDVGAYIKSAQDILVAGQDSAFYKSSPVCFYNEECE